MCIRDSEWLARFDGFNPQGDLREFNGHGIAVHPVHAGTHNIAEGAGAAGLAGVRALAPRLAGKTVGIVISGGNMDSARLRTILDDGTP